MDEMKIESGSVSDRRTADNISFLNCQAYIMPKDFWEHILILYIKYVIIFEAGFSEANFKYIEMSANIVQNVVKRMVTIFFSYK